MTEMDLRTASEPSMMGSRSRTAMLRHTKPRQQQYTRTNMLAFKQFLPILTLVLLMMSGTCAAAVLDRRKEGMSAHFVSAELIDSLQAPPEDQHGNILARQNNENSLGSVNRRSPATASTSSSPSTASTTAEASSASGDASSASSAPPSPASLPRPFDTPLGNNFSSSSCPAFFNKFLNDQNFVNCVPLSLLLLNSQDFFQAESDATTLDQVLSASCSVVSANCNNLMQSYATQLKDSANCGTDYTRQQPSVLRAYEGFVSYLSVYEAGCLKLDPNRVSSSKTSDDDFCYTSSINSSNPADTALYYVPLGVTLPGNSRPTCSSCTQQTMAYFATGAQNLSTPLGQDYGAAAVQVNQGCGPTFVNASVQPLSGTGGTSEASRNPLRVAPWSMAALVGILLVFF